MSFNMNPKEDDEHYECKGEIDRLKKALLEISYRAHYPLCDGATGLDGAKCICVVGVAKEALNGE